MFLDRPVEMLNLCIVTVQPRLCLAIQCMLLLFSSWSLHSFFIIRSHIYVDDVCHFFCWQIHELTMKLSLQKSQYAELKSQFEGQCSLILHMAWNNPKSEENGNNKSKKQYWPRAVINMRNIVWVGELILETRDSFTEGCDSKQI